MLFIFINVIHIFDGRILQPFMKSETRNFARNLSVYFIIHLFLLNLCVMKSNLSDDILYLLKYICSN